MQALIGQGLPLGIAGLSVGSTKRCVAASGPVSSTFPALSAFSHHRGAFWSLQEDECSTSGQCFGRGSVYPASNTCRRGLTVAFAARGRKSKQTAEDSGISDSEQSEQPEEPLEQAAPVKRRGRSKKDQDELAFASGTDTDDASQAAATPKPRASRAAKLAAIEESADELEPPAFESAPAGQRVKGSRAKKAAPEATDSSLQDFFDDPLTEGLSFEARTEPAPVTRKSSSRKASAASIATPAVAQDFDDSPDLDAIFAEPGADASSATGTSASASSTSTPARYDLDLELSKLGGGSSSSLSAATSSRSKEELGAHQMEAKKPMLFGQEVPVEAYEQWFNIKGDEETARLPTHNWPAPSTSGERENLAWAFMHEAQFVRDENYSDYDNLAFASHHEQREKCVNIYANVRHLAGIVKQMDDLDFAMAEKQSYYSSWARSEVLFRPSIDAFNDYVRDNVQNMTRSYPALEAAEKAELVDEYVLVPTDQREEEREKIVASQAQMDMFMTSRYLEGVLPGVSLADRDTGALADDIYAEDEDGEVEDGESRASSRRVDVDGDGDDGDGKDDEVDGEDAM